MGIEYDNLSEHHKFKVPMNYCDCSSIIKRTIKRFDNVKDVNISLEVTVSGKINKEHVLETIKDILNYDI